MSKVLYTWRVLSAPGVPILVQNKMIFCIYNIMFLIGTKKLIKINIPSARVYKVHPFSTSSGESLSPGYVCLSLSLCIPL